MAKKSTPNYRRASSRSRMTSCGPSGPGSDSARSGSALAREFSRRPKTSNLEPRTLNFELAGVRSVQGSRFKVQGSRFKVQRSRFNVRGSTFEVKGSTFKVSSTALPESDGCLVALAVFKTVVGPFCGPGYVRFVPSPPYFRGTAQDFRRVAIGQKKIVGIKPGRG